MIARPFLLALGIAVAPWLPAPAAAQPAPAGPISVSSVTSSDLEKACRQSPDPLSADFCTGYVLGLYDALSISRLICVRPGASTAQALAVGRKYLADHPEAWDQHPAAVLRSAFTTAFPCAGR